MNTDDSYKFRRDKPSAFFRFDPSVTWGSVGSTILVVAAIIIAYEKLDGRTASNDLQITELKSNVSELNKTLIETNLSLRELKTTVQFEGARTRFENKQDK